MVENKSLLLKSTTFYGLLLGIFWVVKYIFFILGSWYPGVGMVYWVLAPLSLVFLFYMGKAYKFILGGKIGFYHAWQFGVLLFFFAALIVSLMHYAFYRFWAPPGFMADAMGQALSIMQSMDLNDQMKQAVDQLTIPTPIQMAVQGVFNNIFYGVVLSIPIALLLKHSEFVFPQNNNQKEHEPEEKSEKES